MIDSASSIADAAAIFKGKRGKCPEIFSGKNAGASAFPLREPASYGIVGVSERTVLVFLRYDR